MDGVVYRGHTPIPGAAQALAALRARGVRVSFITNNATRSRRQLQARLRSMGIPAHENELMTSAYATALYLKSLRPRPRRLYVLGERGLRAELRAAGFTLLPLRLPGQRGAATSFSALPPAERHPRADALVTGLDRHATYSKLAAALDALNAGCPWVACNIDPTLPMESGAHPGSGALAAALAYSAGRIDPRAGRSGSALSSIVLREPDFVVGKPSLYMVDALLGDGGTVPSRAARGGTKASARPARPSRAPSAGPSPSSRDSIAFVGDRLDIDMAFANAAGLFPILVLSGVATASEARRARGPLRPRQVLPSIAHLPRWLGLGP